MDCEYYNAVVSIDERKDLVVYLFDSRVRYSECDCDGKLSFEALLNYFQDCSTFQSEDLDVGLQYMKELNKVWVLSAWQIEVHRYPSLGEKIKIGTLPYEFKSFMGLRNFVMYDEAGAVVAIANSVWTLLDISTNRPTAPTEKMYEKYVIEPKLEMNYASRKIAVPKAGGKRLEPITVKTYNLDTNHHVNNGQYVSIAMGLLPEDLEIVGMRAEYKKQAYLDDIFYPCIYDVDGKQIICLNDEKGQPYFVVEFEERTE